MDAATPRGKMFATCNAEMLTTRKTTLFQKRGRNGCENGRNVLCSSMGYSCNGLLNP